MGESADSGVARSSDVVSLVVLAHRLGQLSCSSWGPNPSHPHQRAQNPQIAALVIAGIPKFYRWLSERYPLLNQKITMTEGPPEIDNLYLDMNGIIHNCTHANQREVKLTEEDMMLKIFDYLDKVRRPCHAATLRHGAVRQPPSSLSMPSMLAVVTM